MTPEQQEALVKALKRATKSSRPFAWWFITAAEDGQPCLLAGRQPAQVKAEAKAVRKGAVEKRTAHGQLHTDAKGGLVFAVEEGLVKPKLVQRALKLELAKRPELKKVKALLQRAVVLPIADLPNAAPAPASADAPTPGLAAQLDAAREEAKRAFVQARERLGGDGPELAELTALRDAATAARKGGDPAAALDAYEELIEACEAAGTDDDAAVEIDDAVVRELAQVWRDAIEDADAQLSALRRVLLRSGDEELHEIAELGLNALTSRHRSRLQAALADAQAQRGDARVDALARVSDLAESFLDHVRSSEQFAVCDDNPFGVKLTLRTTLGGALQRLAAT